MSAAISRFKLPETLDDVPNDIRDAMLAVQEKAGFVPNVFLMLAHRPEEFRAFFGMSNRLVTLAARRLIPSSISWGACRKSLTNWFAKRLKTLLRRCFD